MTMTDRDHLIQLCQRLRATPLGRQPMSDRIYTLCQQLRETPLSDRLLRAWIRHQLRALSR